MHVGSEAVTGAAAAGFRSTDTTPLLAIDPPAVLSSKGNLIIVRLLCHNVSYFFTLWREKGANVFGA